MLSTIRREFQTKSLPQHRQPMRIDPSTAQHPPPHLKRGSKAVVFHEPWRARAQRRSHEAPDLRRERVEERHAESAARGTAQRAHIGGALAWVATPLASSPVNNVRPQGLLQQLVVRQEGHLCGVGTDDVALQQPRASSSAAHPPCQR